MSDFMDYLSRRIGYRSYNDYLKGEHWTNFSSGMRKKSCFCCRVQHRDLQVHHVTYERFGEELPCDVVTLCGGCHIAVHELAKSGTKLEKAHIAHQKRLAAEKRKPAERTKPEKPRKTWVAWQDLRDVSQKQTIDQVREFLEAKGLLDGESATEKAFRLRFAKTKAGKELWDLWRFIHMKQSHKKLAKLELAGATIHPALRRRALSVESVDADLEMMDRAILHPFEGGRP